MPESDGPSAAITDGPYRICPAREEDMVWAAALGERVYHGQDVIPERTMLEWFHANPHGFSTFWHGDVRIGNYDLLPLTAESGRNFCAGSAMEKDFSAHSLVGPAQAAHIHDLHWESIVLAPEFSVARSRVVKLFVLGFPRLLTRLCPLEQIGSISAIAASTQGTGLLRRMGFILVDEGASRLDAHPLYRCTVDGYRKAMARLFRTELRRSRSLP